MIAGEKQEMNELRGCGTVDRGGARLGDVQDGRRVDAEGAAYGEDSTRSYGEGGSHDGEVAGEEDGLVGVEYGALRESERKEREGKSTYQW